MGVASQREGCGKETVRKLTEVCIDEEISYGGSRDSPSLQNITNIGRNASSVRRYGSGGRREFFAVFQQCYRDRAAPL
jgi:hypothetical protein